MGIIILILLVPVIHWIVTETYKETVEIFLEKQVPKTKCVIIHFPEIKTANFNLFGEEKTKN